jgi:hypothetical protein
VVNLNMSIPPIIEELFILVAEEEINKVEAIVDKWWITVNIDEALVSRTDIDEKRAT